MNCGIGWLPTAVKLCRNRTPVPGRFTNAYNQLEDLGTARLLRCTDAALPPKSPATLARKLLFLADQPKAVAAGQPCYLVVPASNQVSQCVKEIGLWSSSLS